MLDEYFLRCGGSALHAVENDDIGTGFDGQRDIIIGSCRPDLDVNWLFPVGDFP